MNLTEKFLTELSNDKGKNYTLKQLFGKFNAYTSFEKDVIVKVVDELTTDGKLVFDSKKRLYTLVDESKFLRGTIDGNPRGFAFFINEEGDTPDLFIAPANLKGALHKDKVLAVKIEGSRDEGRVVSILERGIKEVVGVYQKTATRFVVPDDKKFCKDIYIEQRKDKNAKNGQKVVARITSYPEGDKKPEGEILEVLGFPWEKNVDIMSVASQYGLKESFPMECIKEVSALPDSVSAKDLIGRKDFTGIKCFTIDGEDARDFDDAVSVRANNDGTFGLGVHIADVSHYVTENSATDKEAYERGTSVYFPELVIPMLPTKLSNGLCSLNEKQKRLTLSVTMKINKKGDVVDYEIDKGVISSCHRLTYTEVFAMMTGDKAVRDKYSDIISDIDTMDALAKVLENKRNKRGNIDFQKSEVKFVMDEKGDVVDILPYERNSAHKLIEEFMIIANETVAQYVYNLSLPFVYRVHEKPDIEKMDILMELLKGLGIAVKEKADKIHSSTLQSALREAENTPYFDLVNKVMLRTMQKAKYSPINIGHFGLSSECYCHFTSPIRRYPDLIVHRILSAVLFGKMEEQACKHFDIVCSEGSVQSSIRERVADEAERTVDDLKKCQYAVKYIGESFTGLVSGVAEFGIFVELSNTVEGLVRVENLVGDNYSFNEKKFTLSNGAKTYSLGDKIDVTISSVNVSARKIDFSLKNLD